jgi:hypothetical protein
MSAVPLQPVPIRVPDDVLADLRRRLDLTRRPVDAGNDDWSYGVGRGDNHVNLTAHDHGGHFVPWEIPDQRVGDLRRTFRGRR